MSISMRSHLFVSAFLAILFGTICLADSPKDSPQPAPTGYDNVPNTIVSTMTDEQKLKLQASFDADRKGFESVEEEKDGLGPVYNGASCVECHRNPVTGAASQVAVIRAGKKDPKTGEFIEPPGGSLIFQRAINPKIQVRVTDEFKIRSLRIATNVLGNGFVECIPDDAIRAVQLNQPKDMQGAIVLAPVIQRPDHSGGYISTERVGRFGWKAQEASLLNFSAGAYLNEMGITSPLQRIENSAAGKDVFDFNPRPDVQDQTVEPNDESKTPHVFGVDTETFTRFMRATKAPPVDDKPANPKMVARGKELFSTFNKGCAVCHVQTWTTAPLGTEIGDFKVPASLANKTIEPYSDFMLHNIGTGDGIVQTQHAQRPTHGCENKDNITLKKWEKGPKVLSLFTEMYKAYYDDEASSGKSDPKRRKQRVLGGDLVPTADMMKTAPLWGLRVRPQLMHDGLSLTIDDAIRRHAGEAKDSTNWYTETLSDDDRKALLAFLGTL